MTVSPSPEAVHGIHSQLRLRKKQWAQVLWNLLTRKRLPRKFITSPTFAFLNIPFQIGQGKVPCPLECAMRVSEVSTRLSSTDCSSRVKTAFTGCTTAPRRIGGSSYFECQCASCPSWKRKGQGPDPWPTRSTLCWTFEGSYWVWDEVMCDSSLKRNELLFICYLFQLLPIEKPQLNRVELLRLGMVRRCAC